MTRGGRSLSRSLLPDDQRTLGGDAPVVHEHRVRTQHPASWEGAQWHICIGKSLPVRMYLLAFISIWFKHYFVAYIQSQTLNKDIINTTLILQTYVPISSILSGRNNWIALIHDHQHTNKLKRKWNCDLAVAALSVVMPPAHLFLVQ